MNHVKKLQSLLETSKYDALLLLSPANRFYATGFHSTAGAVVITPESAHFFTDSRYIEKAEREVTGVTVRQTTRDLPYHKLIAEALSNSTATKLGFEDKTLPYATYRAYRRKLPHGLLAAEADIEAIRATKDEEELARIRKAQGITDETFSEILPLLKPGVAELDIAAELVYRMLRKGATRMSFDPIVVSGENGSSPHGVPGGRKLKSGDFLTMDFGCVCDGYCSDMTRTVAIGTPSDEMRRVYDTVLAAQQRGIETARAGIAGADVDAAGRRFIEDAGYGDYFGHGFGHALGIDVHESPAAAPGDKTVLRSGMVLSAEPGIYLPGKFGVRIEDLLVIREGGCENLTASPKELIIL
ncbi:Xaa-Pro peptidase family protein [Oscillospiraceae bacterium OttesenSCG-928-G22]|nr:Xaa-Pro peptidase family protein [Oscillospiraceae bacterium OttesenSCG-928-G22]